jgi:hypothetical protein
MDKDIFKEGRQAYHSGMTKRDNPYDMGTEDAVDWQKGFKAGEREDVDQDPDGN